MLINSEILMSIKIQDKEIGIHEKPFIIAEMSGNHNESLDRALAIVDAAADAGADAVKIQTYTADTITLNVNKNEFTISDPKSLWYGKSLYDLYKQAHTPWEWHDEIFNRCKEKNIICFSSPFDETAVDFLEKIGPPCYKIASFENNHIPLIKKVARTGKPIILSTGMASLSDIEKAVFAAKEAGCNDLILLKCTSSYPADPAETNLNTIPNMRDLFGCEIGLSDHTLGIGVAVSSIALGATVIEKHFTLSRDEGGVDSAFSIEPHELKNLVEETERAWRSLGEVFYGPTNSEKNSLKFRRSLYIAKDMDIGDELNSENLKVIRPGYGLDPEFKEILIGKKVKMKVDKGTPMSWELVL